jgi:hypothetical protein
MFKYIIVAISLLLAQATIMKNYTFATNFIVEEPCHLEFTEAELQEFFNMLYQLNDVPQTSTEDNITFSLGTIASIFESGNDFGAISSGGGDRGGKSYGKYQIASGTTDLDQFIRTMGFARYFDGLEIGSDEFDLQWLVLSGNEDFQRAQTEYVVNQHYAMQTNKLQRSGIDLSDRGIAIQEMVFSTAVQYGPNTNVIVNALNSHDLERLCDRDIVKIVQNYKVQNVHRNFRSSSPDIRESVTKRIINERDLLLTLV